MSDLRTCLEQVRADYGRLTPPILVDAARAPDHPLHSRFEWDNTLAGEAWRRQQAHDLIKSYRMAYTSPSGKEHSIPGYLAVRYDPEDGNGGFAYEPADEIIDDPLKLKIVLADMQREWKQLRQRYDLYNEFWDMIRKEAA